MEKLLLHLGELRLQELEAKYGKKAALVHEFKKILEAAKREARDVIEPGI